MHRLRFLNTFPSFLQRQMYFSLRAQHWKHSVAFREKKNLIKHECLTCDACNFEFYEWANNWKVNEYRLGLGIACGRLVLTSKVQYMAKCLKTLLSINIAWYFIHFCHVSCLCVHVRGLYISKWVIWGSTNVWKTCHLPELLNNSSDSC